MTQYVVEFPVEAGGTAQFELADSDVSGELRLASPPGTVIAERSRETLDTALESLRPALRSIRRALADAAPDHLEVEFGIKVGGESGVIFAKGTAEVHFVVRMTWGGA
ncbi:CU044_2847 family protein [Micromonospora sp. NPDC049497]|uniref:CU044_2847 family protein n=1 Tax=Micromonospora sp. NPDC049497 TaxID=3364273 RepID=UPI003799DC85